ncbi:MAG: fumarylacetoacetate hydrolase family protein [Silvanigrellales bacterium]|jgi:2-keto-4-pentenoate hydratase/2-oxohepta-3-ene-1,7-dioic acid hydratase in catechol pathway|nr:fumarylacetoacetate hydrolase family protein [Silvanigrellales bacterium]
MEKIVCVGKNFLEHARELGDAIPEKPVLFLKPPSVLRVATSPEDLLELRLPRDAGVVHHEAEIVLRLDRGGYRLDVKEAERLIGAVTLGLDMTLRDRQQAQKKAGHPWTTSKVFPDAAVVGPWLRVSEFPDYLTEKFSFALDGRLAQQGFGTEMSFSPAECVAYISEFFPLCAGDLIFTGTPAGVGPVSPGQKGSLHWGSIHYSVLWKAEASQT